MGNRLNKIMRAKSVAALCLFWLFIVTCTPQALANKEGGAELIDVDYVLMADATLNAHSPGFFEQYKYVMAGVLLLVLVWVIVQRKQRKLIAEQKRQLASYSEYVNLTNNMPLCYLKVHVLKDANGMPADFDIIQTNGSLKQAFGGSVVVGQKGSQSAFFADSMKEFKMFFKIIGNEKKNVSFSFYQKLYDKYYDVMLSRSATPGHIDIFFRDYTEFYRMQNKLRSNNHKLALALDVAKIIPWKIDLVNNILTYDDVRNEMNPCANVKRSESGSASVLFDEYLAAMHEEDREAVKNELTDLVTGVKNTLMLEYRVNNIKDGEHHMDWIESRAIIEDRNEAGKPVSVVGSSVVITERKKQERELISAKEHAEESNRLKTAFLANMSHEIRTPLNAIVGFSGILASGTDDEETREYASLIETNNTLLLQLIGDILDLSKIEANSLDLFYSDFDLVHFMKGIEDTVFQKMPEGKNLQVFMDEMPQQEYVHSEMNRLAQILLNILNNAVKFTEKGSIRFGYTHDEKFIRFHVTDTGIGIAADKIGLIFDRFVKFNEFTQGTGLGLSVCKMVVEEMGGEIGVESVEGKGSTFWFTVPYEVGVSRAEGKAPGEVTLAPRARLTILIAEDNDSNYNLFANILKNDYNILHAWDGREAVELFREHRPQIVLMDINMPVMDGYAATDEIRRISPNVPIIAVTAYTVSETEDEAESGQFSAFMNKPVNEQVLKKELSGVLQRRF